MFVETLELSDFRNYRQARFDLASGITAVLGSNGQGKTNFVEALAYLSTLTSFRGVGDEAMVRVDMPSAVIRATVRDDDGRERLIEAEINRTGRNRVQVDRQRLARTRDLLGVLRVTVFSPDDLFIVKGGPGERRRFVDDVLVATALKYDAVRLELERILRQRNRLLKQVAGGRGRLDAEAATTLDVWDAKLAETGERLGTGRAELIAELRPHVERAHADLAGGSTAVTIEYDPPWRTEGLAAALAAARSDDLRRAVTTVGPHRDDLEISVDGLPARTHASQGEQRTVALALRLATHRLVAETTGAIPVLVLDDVLSELDPDRSTALLGHVPDGQVIITSASPLPVSASPDRFVRIVDGAIGDDDGLSD